MKRKNIVDKLSVQMMSKTGDAFDVPSDVLIARMQEMTDINLPGRDGRTVLIHAAAYNRTDLLKWILAHGGNAGTTDSIGRTALHGAVINGNPASVKLLLAHHAPVNAQDSYGTPPLLLATQHQPEIIQMLLNAGADCHLKNEYGISAYMSFEAYPEIRRMMEQ